MYKLYYFLVYKKMNNLTNKYVITGAGVIAGLSVGYLVLRDRTILLRFIDWMDTRISNSNITRGHVVVFTGLSLVSGSLIGYYRLKK